MDKPVLYVIMFEDVPDMNPGKGMAQANHAGVKFCAEMYERGIKGKNEPIDRFFAEWMKEGYNFGTTCVVTTPAAEFITNMENIYGIDFYRIIGFGGMGVVEDTSYPYKTYYGKTFTMGIETCAYYFLIPSESEEVANYLKSLPLHQ